MGEDTLTLCSCEEACFKEGCCSQDSFPISYIFFQTGGLPPPGKGGPGLIVPDREPDDTKVSFYLSQGCPAQFPQEGTLLPLVRRISILSFLKNHSTWFSRFGSFFKTRGLSEHQRLECLCASPWLLLVFQPEGRRLVWKRWS